jgi:hypothetical protein
MGGKSDVEGDVIYCLFSVMFGHEVLLDDKVQMPNYLTLWPMMVRMPRDDVRGGG